MTAELPESTSACSSTEHIPSPELLQRWRDRLTNLTELLLPTDYPRPVPNRVVEAEQVLHVSERVSLAILQLSLAASSQQGDVSDAASAGVVTPFTILLAGFAVLLHKYTGEEDITVGSSSDSANPLVLRFPVRSRDSIETVIHTVLAAEKESAADEVPFLSLLEAVFPDTGAGDAERNDHHHPLLFKVRFFNLTDTKPETLATSTNSSSCDLTIFISQAPTLRRLLPIDIRIVYNTVLFAGARISDMLSQLQVLLETAAKSISAPVGGLSILTKESRLLLPDPAADLQWSSFEGAITDVFSRNARAHPDRICVVESRDTGDHIEAPLREFSYRHINEASNILAHHLLRNGIAREDVVVLYSYRGVDLVVAVMGVLKAGAVFSVVDPAYPPSRQNIYLSVALPQGLVVLSKAGVLHEDVRRYVQEELDIKCTVPALEIGDDGELKGGLGPDGVDVLAPETQMKCQEPGTVLGPDSPSTLSFTSGSTGIPKGVKGRHFSLTHFYPWMRETFDMSAEERFTMLSGIAHDPIQRDIFTPLFLGAQLRIPTSEDIGSPGRLAEWMAYHNITITHLTPAMGQLLSANATTPVPSLRAAFFVGDVLTKRDVLRLQYLAPNVSIINMYGTTETQRAVSYFTIPPSVKNPGFLSEMKDIMPAGRGMKNVQLLVVNGFGALCGIGEMGEILVRSSGLAEGYLDAKASAEKFVPNPFATSTPSTTTARELAYYFGARDRCYKTGDLGRYRSDGSVECTGRADDQVKIRGFRIELKEIDTHLSQCSDVRENVTLVRRDKDEEKVLISYIVPMDASTSGDQLTKSVRDWLKTKLAAYAVPAVIVILKRMPLTPNGKVDKNALPFPDTAISAPSTAASSNDSLTPIQRSLQEIWGTVLKQNAAGIPLNENFFDLGGHSILATRLVFMIRKTLKVDVPLGIVYREPTIVGMSAEIERARDTDLGLASSEVESKTTHEEDGPEVFDYAADLDVLDDPSIASTGLPAFRFPELEASERRPAIFLTGVTGFLGAFILKALFDGCPHCRIVALVRAKSSDDAIQRIKSNGERYLVWNDDWVTSGQLRALCGDLGQDRFGLSESLWNSLSQSTDIIVHNGALVHWVYPYHKLRAANVMGTQWALRLATTNRLKTIHFVSSTSVLDTPHYIRRLHLGEHGRVMEDDDLEGSRTGLRSGYGQTKWVSEKLIMRARSRGVPATIIRPGYIVGDSTTGVNNTDDFLWRLVKGCVQLGKVPRIANIVNMCPVDYVAGIIAAVATSPLCIPPAVSENLGVFQCYNPDPYKFDDLFNQLLASGYPLTPVDYIHWRTALMELTLAATDDNALYPLLHFVLDDLPSSTKAPVLDSTNASTVAPHVACASMRSLMDMYIGFLAHIGFVPPPPAGASTLVYREVWKAVGDSVGSRTGA
ncbi:large subunit of alpha-aminoadipate reductase [Thoreauomyces humboldtii]|nr:large subunit of alpha-aminoadipate reductase [Thoreauomyces humboldtii]